MCIIHSFDLVCLYHPFMWLVVCVWVICSEIYVCVVMVWSDSGRELSVMGAVTLCVSMSIVSVCVSGWPASLRGPC